MSNHVTVFTPGTGTAIEEAMNLELAKVVGDYLFQAYPGYLWRVNVEIKGGIVNILCADVSMQMGCTLPLSKLVNQGDAKKLVHRAGGEILERANLHRGRMIETELATAKRDARGDIITSN